MKIKTLVCTILLALPTCHSLADEIGVQEKVKKAYELYLQDQSVTLGGQQWRLAVDANYTSDEKTLLFSHQESRSVQGGVAVNYGLTDSIELFTRIPISYTNTSVQDVFGSGAISDSETNFGNVTVGTNATIFRSAGGPTITLQMAAGLPTHTGGSPYNRGTISAGVMAYQDFDPAFLYGGLSGTKTLGGDTFDSVGYQVGFGFSLNHRLAIGAELSGGYRIAPQFLSSKENALLTGRATFVLDQKNLLQPSVSFGLNESSPDYVIGLQWTRRF